MKLEKELDVAISAARKAGVEIMQIYYEGIKDKRCKGDGSPVTEADILANEIINGELSKAFPKDGIISEELENVEGERIWYVDPIDGTKQFAGRSEQFAVHIGLAIDKKPVVGIVYKLIN